MTKQQQNSVVALAATVDWLTGTQKLSGMRNKIARAAHSFLETEVKEGARVSMWSSYGYEGWACSGIRWGRRETDDLISLSGERAHEYFGLYAPLLGHCSRVDLAVTVRYQWHDISLAQRCYEAMRELAFDHYPGRNYMLVTNLNGGDTLYVGKRASAQYGRLYDKGLQSRSQDFANCWRYEVEYKRDLAPRVFTELCANNSPENYIAGSTYTWFAERGVQPAFVPEKLCDAIRIKRRKTSDEKSLEWLYAQVRPTVQRLVQRRGIESVLSALELSQNGSKGGPN